MADLKHKLVRNRCSIIENQPRCISYKKSYDKKLLATAVRSKSWPKFGMDQSILKGFVFSILDLEEAKLNKPDDECDKNQEWATGKSQLLKTLNLVRGTTMQMLCCAIFHVVGQLPRSLRSGEDLTQRENQTRPNWAR